MKKKKRALLTAEGAENRVAEGAMPDYGREIISVIRGNLAPGLMKERLEDFHEKDIAGVLGCLSLHDRKKLYRILDTDTLAAVLEYAEEDEAGNYLDEIDLRKIPKIVGTMETDSAVAVLRRLSAEKRALIMELLDDSDRNSISVTASFTEDEIGSMMTSNFIRIDASMSIKEAMSSLIEQAAKNDNIAMLFVTDEKGVFNGAIDLKDLITARQSDELDELIISSFPYVYGQEAVDDCLEKLKDYSESSVPVLDNSNRILGVIRAQSIIEATDEALGEDYAMLAGLTAEEDLEEPLGQSLKKRLPWLLILLALGLVVSSVVGAFEKVVSQLTIIMAFQSLVLDMAGNTGTQSLAVTVRVLSSEGMSFRQKLSFVFKEMRVGLCSGSIMGGISFVMVGLFIFLIKGESPVFSFAVSGCIGLSLLLAMLFSSAGGTLIPMLFKKIGVDPAVASGPLITTVNDLVAVTCYYGLSWLFLLEVFKFGA
ncbi:MAG: magnesium transporter [Candidatus Limivicinus sp.]|jgi:magnesium transporter